MTSVQTKKRHTSPETQEQPARGAEKTLLALYPFFLPPSTNRRLIFRLYTTPCPAYTEGLGPEKETGNQGANCSGHVHKYQCVFTAISLYPHPYMKLLKNLPRTPFPPSRLIKNKFPSLQLSDFPFI